MLTDSFHYRPVFGRILAVAVVVLSLAGLTGLVLAGDRPNLLRTMWPLLLFCALAIALFWRPQVLVEERLVTVVNVFRTFRVPLSAIQRIDTRFSLTLFTPGRRISVWAAPSPGVRGSVAIERVDVTNLGESAYGPGNSVRPGDSVSTPSGQVAFVLRQRWEAVQGEDALASPGSTPDTGRAPDGGMDVTVHWGTIAVLGSLLAASALGVVL